MGRSSIANLPIVGRDEISGLARTLNFLSDQLSKQEELRKNLTQDIAHELRTPLFTLKSHMEGFLDGVWEPSQARLQSCIEEIERFETLVRAVETLHEADSSLQAPRREVDLRQVVRTVIELVETRCKNEGLELSLKEDDHPVPVVGNLDHITQIAWNVLDNAVKYTPSQGAIRVYVERKEDISSLRVSDTGIGIAKHELDKVFERFYRVDKSRNRETGGSGLGLAIVKQLVDVSKGHISIISKEGEGTSVLVEWPHP